MTLRPSLETHSLWMDSDVADGKACHFERASSSLYIMHGGSAGNAAIPAYEGTACLLSALYRKDDSLQGNRTGSII